MKLTTRQKMTIARAVQRPVLVARRAARRGPTVRTRRRGLTWCLDLREGIDFAIWLQGAFEPGTVAACRRLVRPDATVLDIGANMGAHTLPLADAVGPDGRVVAFEPASAALERLRANLAANPALAPRVTVSQTMLLSHTDAPLPSDVVASWPLGAPRSLDRDVPGVAQTTAGASVATLDAALGALDVESVSLIKLDVDGFECEVLDGAADTLDRHRPAVVTELAANEAARAGHTLVDVVERLTGHGYELWDLRGRHRIGQAELDRLVRWHASTNVLALPGARP